MVTPCPHFVFTNKFYFKFIFKNTFFQSLHPLIRTSQVSLSSNADADFRYTNIFTTVGMYKNRMLAIKRLERKSVDISRKMKKELKLVRLINI